MMLRRVTPAQWRFAGGMAILIGCATDHALRADV